MIQKLILAIIASMLLPAIVFGDSDVWSGNVPLGNHKWLGSRDPSTFVDLPILRFNASNNIEINQPKSGGSLQFEYLKTPIAKLDSTGFRVSNSSAGYGEAHYIATVSTNLTPVEGANDVRPYTEVATACPTNAALGLPSVPLDGAKYKVINAGANPLVIAALGTPVMNQGTNRRISVAAKGELECEYSLALVSWLCKLFTALPTPAA